MRDALGDALERMARREEVERLRAAAAAQTAGMPATVGVTAGIFGGPAPTPHGSVAAELAEAIRQIAQNHPGTIITASVEGTGGEVSMQASWVDGQVVVRPGPAPDAAARLAEMIRRDPTLLAPEPD
ncbi:MAG TPA: hypothetical protein VI011_13235 [Asanoa sp.]|jgi:hypothetical protein